MKVCIIQPAYSTDYAASHEYFEREQADASVATFHDRIAEAVRAWKKNGEQK